MPSVTKDSGTDTIDAYIWNQSGNEYDTKGAAAQVIIGRVEDASKGDYTGRGFFAFDLGSDLPVSVKITYAKLSLKSYLITTGGRTQVVYRCLRHWVESEVSWYRFSGTGETCPTTGCWATAGCGNSSSDYTTTDSVSFTAVTSTGTWKHIDDVGIRNQVQWAVSNDWQSVRRVSFFVRQTDESNYNSVRYYSKDWSTAADRPQLYIEYRRRMASLEKLPLPLQFVGVGLAWIINRRMVLEKCSDGRTLFHGTKRRYKKWLRRSS